MSAWRPQKTAVREVSHEKIMLDHLWGLARYQSTIYQNLRDIQGVTAILWQPDVLGFEERAGQEGSLLNIPRGVVIESQD